MSDRIYEPVNPDSQECVKNVLKFLILPWAHPGFLQEDIREIVFVRKIQTVSDFLYRQRGIFQKQLCSFDLACENIVVRCYAISLEAAPFEL